MNKEQQTAGYQGQQPDSPQTEGTANIRQESIDFSAKGITFEAETTANMNKSNSTINSKLYGQIEAQCIGFRLQVQNIAQQYNVPQDISEAIQQDYADILQDNFEGLNMTPERFLMLTQLCTAETWWQIATNDKIFEGLLLEYTSISSVIDEIKKKESIDFTELPNMPLIEAVHEYTEQTAHTFAKVVTESEVLRYYGHPNPVAHDKAAIYRHIHCLAHLRQLFITTDEDLLPILPCHCSNNVADILLQSNGSILRTADEQMPKKEGKLQAKVGGNDIGRRGRPKKKHEQPQQDSSAGESITTALTTKKQPQIIERKAQFAGIWANAMNALCGEILTAAAGENGQPLNAQPLMQIIQDEYNSGNTDVTLTPVKQVMTQICMLPTRLKPTEETEEYLRYNFTLGEGIEMLTGNSNPNTQTLRAWFCGYMFFSSHYVALTELRCSVKRNKGIAEPTNIYKPYTILTQIVRATFIQEGEVIDIADMASKSTEIKLYVHKAIATGRRRAYIGSGKEEERIKKPKRLWFMQEQIQDFTSPAGIAFFALIHHASRKLELKTWNERGKEDILSEVFDYRTKLKLKTATELLNAERRKAREELKELQQKYETCGSQLQGRGLLLEEVLRHEDMQRLQQAVSDTTALIDTPCRLFVRVMENEVKKDSSTWTALQALTADAAKWETHKTEAMRLLTEYMHSKTKENIRINKPRDRKQLQAMFEKAKANGTILDYERKKAANGVDWVWTWTLPHGEKPEDAEAEELTEAAEQ